MNAYKKYEALKAEWVKANPGSTPKQYEAAMRLLAEKCGI